jgi:hypothetical protein
MNDPRIRIIIGVATILVASLLVVTMARAGDYAVYDCRPTKIVMSMPDDGSGPKFSSDSDGHFKKLSKRLFRIKELRDGSYELYYRGKLCIELDE